jgi:4a-hydroxytetrahydrobiopterin dehydratase
MSSQLTATQIEAHLAALTGWTINDKGELSKTFPRKDFMDGLAFVTRIAVLAEKAGHHPDLLLTWPSVQVRLITHDAGGLTLNDFSLAEHIDGVA